MKLFPSGIAKGAAFCNREKEREQLSSNIKNIEHTVLLAPRRYGKTSLASKVMTEIDTEHAWIELFSATSFESAERKIALALGDLIYQLAPDLKKLELKIKQFFKKLKPEIVLSGFGQKVVLHPLSSPIESITEILIQLDLYATSLNKKIVIVFDEFQQIAEIKDGHALEACIRQAVERSQSVTYLFSGSNRHMLTEMFGHSSRPLYRLCKLLTLNRISQHNYEQFIQQAAINKWQQKLANDTFNEIMRLTERHPYYTNILCEQLWKQQELPGFETVEETWRNYIFTHKTMIISEIIELSLNQKKCINALAASPTKEPLGKTFQRKTNLSLSSLKQVIDVLYDRDIIYKDDSGTVRVLDPAVSYLIVSS